MTSTILQLSEPYGQIAFQEAGTGDPLVLIHGVGLQSAAWTPQIETFCKTHRVIALDMPGHGESSPLPDHEPDLTNFVEWLRKVLSAFDLGPVNLVGHSMGALIAGGFAVEYPNLILRLAVLNGVFRRNTAARTAVEARAKSILHGQIDLETPLKRWFGDSKTDQAAAKNVAQWLGNVNRDGYAAAYSAFAHGDDIYADRWSEILCPVLALTGEDDPNSTPTMSREMAKAARNGHAMVLAGQRHMANLTAPSMVNACMLEWLDRPVTGSCAR